MRLLYRPENSQSQKTISGWKIPSRLDLLFENSKAVLSPYFVQESPGDVQIGRASVWEILVPLLLDCRYADYVSKLNGSQVALLPGVLAESTSVCPCKDSGRSRSRLALDGSPCHRRRQASRQTSRPNSADHTTKAPGWS